MDEELNNVNIQQQQQKEEEDEVQDEVKDDDDDEEKEEEPLFGQTQSKAESPPVIEAPPPSMDDLQRRIAVLTVRIDDANNHAIVREENLRKSINDLTVQNSHLRDHLKSLDQFIKKLSLVHSQLTAAPNYKLAKADVDEMIRLVSSL